MRARRWDWPSRERLLGQPRALHHVLRRSVCGCVAHTVVLMHSLHATGGVGTVTRTRNEVPDIEPHLPYHGKKGKW